MAKITPPPRVNILEALPELAAQTTTTIRLHPRHGDVPELSASKIGGTFLWPDDEPWPIMPSRRPDWYDNSKYFTWDIPDATLIAFVPVLQINARDVPDFSFPPGKDLLQLLWYPLNSDERRISRVFWRNSHEVTHPLAQMPASPHASERFISTPCILTFERVVEYPDSDELTSEQCARIDAWIDRENILPIDPLDDIKETLYEFELSVCPGNKLGGYVAWIQYAEWKTCDNCGRQMEHLLTLTDMDVDGGTWVRWLAVEDRDLWINGGNQRMLANAPDWGLGGGSMYYLVCRYCADWPVKVVYQR
jgi:hypothetical protein